MLAGMKNFSTNGFSFFDKSANNGVRDFTLRYVLDDGRPRWALYSTLGPSSATADLGGGLTLTTSIKSLAKINAIVVTHTFSNAGAVARWVRDVATVPAPESGALLHGKGNWLGWNHRYMHTDNVRTEHYPHCQMEYPLVRMLPDKVDRLGAGEDQSYPALYIVETASKAGIVFAAASQKVNYTTFDVAKEGFVNNGISPYFAIQHDPAQTDGFEVAPGKTRTLDGLFIQLTQGVSYEDAYADYEDYIASTHTFLGKATPLLREAFHCTWNYGVFGNQYETNLLPTARRIAKKLPNIKWFLMDAGYLSGDESLTFLDRFYPDPDQWMGKDKWPRGIRGYADEVRALGLRPGIWWSPTVRVPSRLFTEHPDWFARLKDGSPYLIGGNNAFLDYTHPEALAYLDRVLRHFHEVWGMEAFKMDFWSQNFEDRSIRLYDPTLTALEAKAKFMDTVRRNLPKDGIFMLCVATGMGNPFTAEWADTYRNTIDIGVGKWHEQIDNCCWALPTLLREGRKTFLLNNDSVGIMKEYPDNENFFRLTWSYINMGMIETGGKMETWSPKWIAAMRKLTDRCDRGYRVRCPDDRAFTGIPLPEVLFVDFPKSSPTAKECGVKQSVALFNWTDEPKMISVARSRLGHRKAVKAENFWTGKKETFKDEFLQKRLPPRSAMLYDIQG